MYKLLLSWRYLRSRYIALASIISVTLGVATMIVVNSVMSGFTTEMRNRIHGILSDVVFESRSLEGFADAPWHMAKIREIAGDQIEAMTPTVVVPAMLSFQVGEEWITRQVQLIGIDETTQSRVSDFSDYLQHPENRRQLSFELREHGYDTIDHQAGPGSPERPQMAVAGWNYRLQTAIFREAVSGSGHQPQASGGVPTGPAADGPSADATTTTAPADPFAMAEAAEPAENFDPKTQQHPGLVLGIALASYRKEVGEDDKGNRLFRDFFLVLPGDDVKLTFPTAGVPPKATSANFTIVDFYESKMSEYDQSFVFAPIRQLQEDRGMYDYVGDQKRYYVNSIQIKLKPGVDGAAVRDRLRAAFPGELYLVSTWRDKQGALLAAVQMETAILNVLLFLIIAVAGFGILAIFFMIVVEKTRDIGVLKALGASGWGVMEIFLAYGLSLGLLGSGVGLGIGLWFVGRINGIADLLGRITGHPVFDPEIYYFYKIPVLVSPLTVAWIVAGAVLIAVLASVLPAFRAARLHPVEALRYE